MTDNSLAQNAHFRDFFNTIAPWIAAYRHRVLTFVAVTHEGFDTILRGRLDLSPWPHKSLKLPFRTRSLRASQHYVPGDPRSTEEQLLSGIAQGLVLSDGHARLVSDGASSISPWSQVRGEWSRLPDVYAAQLTLAGINTSTLLRGTRPQLERELLQSDHVFSSLEEWARDFGLTLSTSDSTVLEVLAERVAWFDSGSSITGDNAELTIRLAAHLDPTELRLKAANADSKGPRIQEIANGSSIEWSTDSEGALQGTWRFKLPHEAVLRCTAIYGAGVQHELELQDSRAIPNRARLMVELTDPGLVHLCRLLMPTNPRSESSRAFEAAVHQLLHLAGFRSGHASALTHMESEVDVLALSPAGDALFVECKTVAPDVRMLDKVLSRAAAARKALCTPSSRFSPDRVIPVMVVPNAWDEIGPAAKEHANAHGIVILYREEIEKLILRTRFAPDADAVLKDWLRRPLDRVLSGQLRV